MITTVMGSVFESQNGYGQYILIYLYIIHALHRALYTHCFDPRPGPTSSALSSALPNTAPSNTAPTQHTNYDPQLCVCLTPRHSAMPHVAMQFARAALPFAGRNLHCRPSQYLRRCACMKRPPSPQRSSHLIRLGGTVHGHGKVDHRRLQAFSRFRSRCPHRG